MSEPDTVTPMSPQEIEKLIEDRITQERQRQRQAIYNGLCAASQLLNEALVQAKQIEQSRRLQSQQVRYSVSRKKKSSLMGRAFDWLTFGSF